LSGCTYNDEICFIGIESKCIVCHQTRERSLSAVDMYTWVLSAYK